LKKIKTIIIREKDPTKKESFFFEKTFNRNQI